MASPERKAGKSGQPRRPSGGSRSDRILAHDRAAASRGDLVVRFGGPPPGREELTGLGLTEREVEVASAVLDRGGEVARRVAEHRGFAAELATDPGAALGLGGAVAAPGSTATPIAAGVSRRFELRGGALGDLSGGEPAPESAVSGLVVHTIRAARVSEATWWGFVADPDPMVASAAGTFPWAERGVPPESAAAASVVQEVIARFRQILGLPGASGSSDGVPGPARGSGVEAEIAVLPDLHVGAAILVQSIRVPATPAQV